MSGLEQQINQPNHVPDQLPSQLGITALELLNLAAERHPDLADGSAIRSID